MIPILMDNTKQLAELVNDTTCVLRLTDVITCEVEEEANGAYTATMVLPLTEEYRKALTDNAIIKIKANPYDSLQLFRVNKVTTTMTQIELELNHITYDLSKTSVLPCSATNAAEAMQTIKANMTGGDAFTLSTNLDTKATFTNSIPQSARSLFGGQDGSLLDVYGGYYYWDNLTVTLGKRGADNGVAIRYGKNLVTAEQERALSGMYTAVQPYATRDDNTTVGTYKTLIENANPVMVLNLDLSSYFDAEEEITVEKIDEQCSRYITANDLTTPTVAIAITYEDLQKYGEQYKEEVKLCDTVHVHFEKLGINSTAKVVGYTFDTLAEKYTEVEIGNVKSSLSSSIATVANKTAETIRALVNSQTTAVNTFSELITNGLGLFETKETQPDGSVKLYLHNKPKKADSSVWYTINADGLAISQDKGETWTAGIDSEGNAVVNALSANIIKALQIYGSYIYGSTIKSPNLIFQADDSGTYDIKVQQGQIKVDDTWYKGIAVVNSLAAAVLKLSTFIATTAGDLFFNAGGNAYIQSKGNTSIVADGTATLSSSNGGLVYLSENGNVSITGKNNNGEYFNIMSFDKNTDTLRIAQNGGTSTGIPVVSLSKNIELGLSESGNALHVFNDNTYIGKVSLT